MEFIPSRHRARNNPNLPLFDWAERTYRPTLLNTTALSRHCTQRWGINPHVANAILAANGFETEVWHD